MFTKKTPPWSISLSILSRLVMLHLGRKERWVFTKIFLELNWIAKALLYQSTYIVNQSAAWIYVQNYLKPVIFHTLKIQPFCLHKNLANKNMMSKRGLYLKRPDSHTWPFVLFVHNCSQEALYILEGYYKEEVRLVASEEFTL